MSSASRPRIAVVGAGPIGLEAALTARCHNCPVTVFEAGRIGEHLRQWGHVRLFSPFALNATPLGRAAILEDDPNHVFPDDDQCTTGAEHLERYLMPLAASSALRGRIRANTRVSHIGKRTLSKGEAIGDARRAEEPFRLLLTNGDGEESVLDADVVLDCTGVFGQPRYCGPGGGPALGERSASGVSYRLDDILGVGKRHYLGKKTLVVGAGYSAATSVCHLARLAEEDASTRIVWAVRRDRDAPMQRIAKDALPERDRLAERANRLAAHRDGCVDYLCGAVIESIWRDDQRRFTVGLRRNSKTELLSVDRIIANVGFTPDTQLYRELQVHECYASLGPIKLAATLLGQAGGDCLQQSSPGPDTLRNPEPNFFILGSKSYGRNSLFLLRIGFEQVRDVFSLILNND